MMDGRLTNKRLVKFLMDRKGIDFITVSKDKVVCTVSERFKPEDGERLVRDVGHERFFPTRKNGRNIIILERY